MNWSLIILGLVAISSVAIADNSYLIMVPKLLKVGHDNQLSVFIAAASQPVEVKFELILGQERAQCKTTVKPGETRNATMTLPKEFPVGPAQMIMTGTGGVQFEEKRDIIVYDNRHIVLVQTSASTYRPGDMMDVRVVATNEELIPVEHGEVLIEFYDANLKLVGQFPRTPMRSGLTETLKYPIDKHCNVGTWLVSATIGNTTSSVQVLVAEPVTPSFDLKAIFQRYLLRTDKHLRGVIEIDDDNNQPMIGHGIIAVGSITEEDVQKMMQKQRQQQKPEPMKEEWRKWKSQKMDIAGRVEVNYDLSSVFGIDLTKAVALQVYIEVTDLRSGQERFIQHIIPIFTRDVIYDIRPLTFTAGIKNEFEIIAKRPDGKPAKMEDLIVTVTMMMGNEHGRFQEEKSVEIKDFYTRGRTDIGFFNIDIPERCVGLLMTITPLGEDGKVRGYRTHAIPLMPTPRRTSNGGKLTIELLPSQTAPVSSEPNAPVVSSQISTVGHTSNFYVQLIPSKPVEKFEKLPMSYVLLTNGRISHTGEFMIQPTKECQSKTTRSIKPEEHMPPTCVFNGTLPIHITREMRPYSILLVYTFQPSFGFHVAESYRFSVAGFFEDKLTLNATIVPHTHSEAMMDGQDSSSEQSTQDFNSHEHMEVKPVPISSRAQGKSRVELSFTGTPGSTVGLNVFEYDGVIQGLSNEITKERVLQYLTAYEQIPIVGMPVLSQTQDESTRHTRQSEDPKDDHTAMTADNPHMELNRRSLRRQDTAKLQRRHEMLSEDRMEEPGHDKSQRSIFTEDQEKSSIHREQMGWRIRYPIEKMVFGVSSLHSLKPVEGDDAYTTPNMERLYGDANTQRSQPYYRRRAMKSLNQYDVSVEENNYVVATSAPMVMKAMMYMPNQQLQQDKDNMEVGQENETQESREKNSEYGTSSWYEKINSKLSEISPEAFTFMQSGLAVVTDFTSLHIPQEMRRSNLTKLFSRYRHELTMNDPSSFNMRDEARLLLEDYLFEADMSMIPPPIMLEEQARIGYYRSTFFNTSRIESQGTGKVIVPRTKPYSTWLATGFSLNPKSGLAFAQPIRLPANHGLFILGNFPQQVQIGEHVLLSYGINNYLGKDLSNVVVRIRASADFDLIEQGQPERAASSNGKDYTITIPTLKTSGVMTRNIVLVPKRAGVVKILLEVESEFGGDHEVLTTYVRESGIERKHIRAHLYDLTSEKKSYGPIVEKITPSPFLRTVSFTVSGTGVQRLLERYTAETNSLVGIDRALVRLWRLLGLRSYLNETSQMQSPLNKEAVGNLTKAYQKLQLYADYDGSYSFISDQGEQISSLYLTSLAFGALISPYMPVRDNVTINRTLAWILSHQKEDGSFDDNGPCFHYRFCTGEYRRESLTALVLYAMTRNNVSHYAPEYVRRVLYEGERSPIARAQHYLESRLEAVKPCLTTTTLIELALIQCRNLPEQLKQKIFQNVRSRQLTVVPEDSSRYLKNTNEKMTFDDQLLVNALTLSIYAQNGDMKTTSDMARWIVEQIQVHPHCDTVLDAVFQTEAWLRTDCLFRQRFGSDKFSVVVDVSADNGQKQQFKIDASNMDMRQKFRFTLPVNQITYTVNGFGIASVCIRETYIEKQQQEPKQPSPFQLTTEFTPKSWLSEITAKTCLTYTPTSKDKELTKETFNRTIVVDVQLPSGMRINLHQIGLFLSRVPEMMYFTFDETANKINFFLNVPSTEHGKPICFEWCLERLSVVSSWAPIRIGAYDYLRQEFQVSRLVPIQFQPNLLGYDFVEAAHKARPSFEQYNQMRQQAIRN